MTTLNISYIALSKQVFAFNIEVHSYCLTPYGLTGLNLQALADVLNFEHYSAISKAVGRLNTLMVEDRKVKLQ